MGSDGNKKKFTIIGMASVLLVAAVVGTVVGVKKYNGGSHEDGSGSGIASSNKAVTALCQQTDYKKSCQESLADADESSDPKDLVKMAFNAAVKRVQEAMENSSTIKEAAKDPMASQALDICKGLLNTSIDDLRRSFDKVGVFDISKMDDYVADLKTWLSGAVTYQETCLDAFENTTGDAGEKMKKLLKLGGELTSNALAMVNGIDGIMSDMQFSISRRLLDETSNDDYIPYPKRIEEHEGEKRNLDETSNDDYQPYPSNNNKRRLDETSGDDYRPYPSNNNNKRRLLDEASHDDYQPFPSWTDGQRRALLATDPKNLKPNAVVAQDGSGTFKTIMDAINAAPKKGTEPYVILIKKGTYKEYVDVPRHVNNVVFIGEGPTLTRITGNKNYIDGVTTYRTSTVSINGDGFMARDIAFENTAGPLKHQAVALRVSGDMAIFFNCAMDGYQDTLYTHSYRQFYRQCSISGTIDFVFGDAAAVFQDCKFIVRKPLDNQACMVTAQGRKDHHSVGGIIIQGSTITGERELMEANPAVKSYLGRPWKEFSRTIIMQTFIDKNIVPEGWSPWAGTFGLDTSYYAEFNNRGPGSDTSKRVTWKSIKKITPQEAESFTPGKYIQGDTWIKASGVPYDSGMMKV